MKIEHAIFDMDGTLTDSNGVWMDGVFHYIETLCPYSKEDLPDIFFSEIVLGGTAEALRFLKDNMGDDNPPELITRTVMEGVAKGYDTPQKVKKGALDFLMKLKEKGADVCVVSATPLVLVNRALELCGLMPYIDFVISADDRKTGKEKPYIFLEAAARMNCEVSDCVLFEDAIYSIRTGRSLGMRCVGIDDFYCKPEVKKEISEICDIYTDDYSNIKLD